MGDARLRMDLPYKNFHARDDQGVPLTGGGPENFYHMMVVDAFSSDAIPVHLITKEAIEMYFKHLTKDGILCVHTSNRYVNLPIVVAAVANDLGYAYQRGHDQAPGRRASATLLQNGSWLPSVEKEVRIVDGKTVTEDVDPLASLFVPKDYQELFDGGGPQGPQEIRPQRSLLEYPDALQQISLDGRPFQSVECSALNERVRDFATPTRSVSEDPRLRFGLVFALT